MKYYLDQDGIKNFIDALSITLQTKYSKEEIQNILEEYIKITDLTPLSEQDIDRIINAG